ncbi:diguanylate cyclase [Permianibacter sp. IMCC34836]|uniref:diguanylate cyclase domain-containing protein n=1 Tax=Permianibacter fluminis TaxID=2738515 RepID=UPI0015543BB4|nr:diguanylate cyclase [Permianibacter fluminis]NQD38452.1 diguanylate cyclase [Permianibacter fluminis]
MLSELEKNSAILIVDDSIDVIHLLSHILSDYPNLYFASDAATALEQVRLAPPDLILLDVELPDATGYEVCKQLISPGKTHSCAIIMMTASSNMESEAKSLESGASDFIAKPFNPASVKARVKTQLRLHHQSAALAKLVNQDSLTTLYNRRYFDSTVTEEFERHRRQRTPLTIALIDIDHFKAFNDGYGHLQGDETLRQVALAINASCRRPGETVARYGGEEFAVILPHTDLVAAQALGSRLCLLIGQLNLPHAYSGTGKHVTVSVGLATSTPGPLDTAVAQIAAADQALYRAKSAGRNRAVAVLTG